MVTVRRLLSQLTENTTNVNDLSALRDYLESDASSVKENAASVEYAYGVAPQLYRQNADGTVRGSSRTTPSRA